MVDHLVLRHFGLANPYFLNAVNENLNYIDVLHCEWQGFGR